MDVQLSKTILKNKVVSNLIKKEAGITNFSNFREVKLFCSYVSGIAIVESDPDYKKELKSFVRETLETYNGI